MSIGVAARMVPAYVEDFQRLDPFARPSTWLGPGGLRLVSLDEFNRPTRPEYRRYLDSFLFRGRIYAKVVTQFAVKYGNGR